LNENSERNNSANTSWVTAAVIFLAGSGLALWLAAPFFGWGSGPEMGFGAMTLRRVSLLGFPLVESIGRLSASIPSDAPEFSSAILFSIMFGLTMVFIYNTASRLSGLAAAGVLAAVSFASYPPAVECFLTCSADAWSLFLASAMFAAATDYFGRRSKSGFLFMILAAGLGMFQNGFFAIALIALIVYIASGASGAKTALSAWAAAALIVSFCSIPLIFLIFRPPLFINWTTKLTPWLDVISLKELPSLLFAGVNFRIIPFHFIEMSQRLTGAYLPLFAAAAIGIVLQPRPRSAAIIILYCAAGISALFLLLTAQPSGGVYPALFFLFLSIAGAQGAALIISKIIPLSKASFAAGFLCLILAAIPAAAYHSKIAELRPSHSRNLLLSYFKTMKRDAILILDVRDEPLYGLNYLQQFRGFRPDADIITTDYFLRKKYRAMIRKQISASVIPDEKQYQQMMKQVTAIMPDTGGQKLNPYILRRIATGIITMLQENMLFTNFTRRPLYFNRVDGFFSSNLYILMQFAPDGYLFHLRPQNDVALNIDAHLELARKARSFDPESRRLIAVYYENIGENFFTQQRYEPATRMLEAASKLDPNNISCHFFLGLVYKYWGRYDGAVEQYQAALRLLDRKKLRGIQDSMDIFMYERIYTELGMPEKAEKYNKLVSPEGNMLPPGMKRP